MEEEIHLKEKKELSNWQKMIIYFFIYALLGWILETVYCLITVGTFHKRGFLYGPICPIYGFGAILLLLSLKKVKGNYFTKFLIPGTPKDLLVYIGGLLPFKPIRFILISTFVRFPSVISSTIAGDNIATGNWKMMLITYGITFLVTGIIIFIVNRFDKNKTTKEALDVIK